MSGVISTETFMRHLPPFARNLFIATILFIASFLAAQQEPGALAFTPRPAEAPSANTLNATFGERSLTISGVTVGGRLVVFGVARELLNTKPATPAVVIRAEILTDADRDGIVRLDFPVPVPRRGMWSVADLQTGAHAAFPTPGYEPRRVELVPELLRNDNAGQLNKLEWPFSQIDLLVCRPGVGGGAWRFYASKASLYDENRSNGKRALRIDVAHMIRIGDSPEAPGRFKNGDVVAVFDRGQMQYGILEVGR